MPGKKVKLNINNMDTELTKIEIEIAKAIEKGWDHTTIQWKRAALTKLHELCLNNQTLTGNEITKVIKELPVKTHNYSAMGGLVTKARSFGWMRKTGQTVESASAHASVPIQVWESLIYKPNLNL